jgi:hypothetical protein
MNREKWDLFSKEQQDILIAICVAGGQLPEVKIYEEKLTTVKISDANYEHAILTLIAEGHIIRNLLDKRGDRYFVHTDILLFFREFVTDIKSSTVASTASRSRH